MTPSFRMDEPGSPRTLRNSRVFIYVWTLFDKRVHALLAALAKAGIKQVELSLLSETPQEICELKRDDFVSLRFPLVTLDGCTQSFDSVTLRDHLRELSAVSDEEALCHVNLPQRTEFAFSTPLVEYLDKPWKWSALVFNIIETFGCSVGKSLDDPALPEDFLIDCLRRNVEVESPSDCRLLIFELTNSGILEEVKYQEYKLSYHKNQYGLNCNREPFDENTEVPPLLELMSYLVSSIGRVRRIHSADYLEFVDASHYLRSIKFNDILRQSLSSIVNRKLLADLHAIMSVQLRLLGVILESDRAKYFYEFADMKVHANKIRDEILKLTSKKDKEAISCLLYLGWTLPGDETKDQVVLEFALKTFTTEGLVTEKSSTYAPSFLKGLKGVKKYDIHISPYLSL